MITIMTVELPRETKKQQRLYHNNNKSYNYPTERDYHVRIPVAQHHVLSTVYIPSDEVQGLFQLFSVSTVTSYIGFKHICRQGIRKQVNLTTWWSRNCWLNVNNSLHCTVHTQCTLYICMLCRVMCSLVEAALKSLPDVAEIGLLYSKNTEIL